MCNQEQLRGAIDCLKYHESSENEEQINSTFCKWRKDYQPGKMILHAGIRNDFKEGHEHGKIFGIVTLDSDTVEELWAETEITTNLHNSDKDLGRAMVRGHRLPDYMHDKDYRHGIKTASGDEDAKSLLYAATNLASTSTSKANSFEKEFESHCEYVREERKKRHDCKKIAIEHSRSSGVSEALCMEDNTAADRDELLRALPRVANDDNKIFGIETRKSPEDESAAKCLQATSPEDNCLQNDLGTSRTPGFRNVSTERCFGCPSVRSDIPRYSNMSMADTSNYGDGESTDTLLKMSHLSSFGLDGKEFSQPRSKEYIKCLFSSCDTDPCPFDVLFDSVASISGGGDAVCSIADFRDAYVKWMMDER